MSWQAVILGVCVLASLLVAGLIWAAVYTMNHKSNDGSNTK